MFRKTTTTIDTLPKEIQDKIFSEELNKKIEGIGKNYNLHIDQIGELSSEVRMILSGMTRSKDFIDRLTHIVEIDQETSKKIATDVNSQIFESVRNALQTVQNQTEKEVSVLELEQEQKPTEDNSDLATAGNFTIENGPETAIENNTVVETGTDDISKEKMLNSIEHPTHLQNVVPINMIQKEAGIVDHMLAGPTVGTSTATQVNMEEVQKKMDEESKKEPSKPTYSVDPYREQF